MNKLLLYISLLLGMALNAQIVNIPDADFKYMLVTSGQEGIFWNVAKDLDGNLFAIDANGDGEIQVSEALEVSYLSIVDNEYFGFTVESLHGIEAFTNVTSIQIASFVTTVDLTSLTNLTYVYITDPGLSSLNVTGLTELTSLVLAMPEITSLDISTLSSLEHLQISEANELTSLNVGNNTALEGIWLSVASLPSLDLSGCPNIQWINLSYYWPAQDVYLNLKNGNPNYLPNSNTAVYFNYNEGGYKCFVCVDEGEAGQFENLTEDIFFGTYCDFTPGGNYNTITGTVTFDADNNGCDASDILLPYVAIEINDGTTTGYSYTSNGTYSFYTQDGTFTLTPQFENDWFTAAPETITFSDNNNNTATQNFCVTANGVHNDVEISILPLVSAQPGFDAIYKIVYKNKGNQTLNGDVAFNYNDDVLDYVSASPAETSSTAGSLSWGYSNLLPFESREIIVTLNVNGPVETPAVNINDVLLFTATITPVSGDETPDDNTFEYNQTVIGSFDPNDITCLEGAVVSPDKIGEYLHYNINFENTGTAPATFVVVKDVIDTTKYDINTLQILDASHAMQARITGNKAEFIFDNINLAANGGKGNVAFKIKTLNSLAINSSVTQQADIYFDYNWPIVTNEATTTFAVLNTNNPGKDTSVKLYPNPAKNTVNITAQSNIQALQLYDVQGRLLQAANANGLTATIDVAGRAAGIYFIKVATDKGIAVEKLVKE